MQEAEHSTAPLMEQPRCKIARFPGSTKTETALSRSSLNVGVPGRPHP